MYAQTTELNRTFALPVPAQLAAVFTYRSCWTVKAQTAGFDTVDILGRNNRGLQQPEDLAEQLSNITVRKLLNVPNLCLFMNNALITKLLKLPKIEVGTIQNRLKIMRSPTAPAAFFLPGTVRTTKLTTYTTQAFIANMRDIMCDHVIGTPTSLLNTLRNRELKRPLNSLSSKSVKDRQ